MAFGPFQLVSTEVSCELGRSSILPPKAYVAQVSVNSQWAGKTTDSLVYVAFGLRCLWKLQDHLAPLKDKRKQRYRTQDDGSDTKTLQRQLKIR
jgi:hypothetical protein